MMFPRFDGGALTGFIVLRGVPEALLECTEVWPVVVDKLVEVIYCVVGRELVSVHVDDGKACASSKANFGYGWSSRHISMNKAIG